MRTRFVALGVCALVAALALPRIVDTLAARQAARLLREATLCDVRIGAASLELPRGPLVLRGVAVLGPDGSGPLLGADRVEAAVSPWRLVRPGVLDIPEMLVQGLRLNPSVQALDEFALGLEAAARLQARSGGRPVRIGRLYLGRGAAGDADTAPAIVERSGGETGLPPARLLAGLLPLLRRPAASGPAWDGPGAQPPPE